MKVVIIGGVGNGTVIAQAIRHAQISFAADFEVAGYMSDRNEVGSLIEGFPVIARTSSDDVKRLTELGYRFIYTVYRIDGQKERLDLFEGLGLTEDNLATFIHPSAYVAPDVIIEAGAVIMPYVMISSAAKIGTGSLLMVGCSIGHNTELGMANHVAAQAVMGACIKTGIGVHIGLNATIRENIQMGDYSTLGMGAVLTKNVGASEVWAGNPARFLRGAE